MENISIFMNPVSTVQSSTAEKRPASFPLVKSPRKVPKVRNIFPNRSPNVTTRI